MVFAFCYPTRFLLKNYDYNLFNKQKKIQSHINLFIPQGKKKAVLFTCWEPATHTSYLEILKQSFLTSTEFYEAKGVLGRIYAFYSKTKPFWAAYQIINPYNIHNILRNNYRFCEFKQSIDAGRLKDLRNSQ
ncbi:hypothetical protein L1049_012335 [Liquidambar formosana]|uniref:Uncharacterized protein n=1 Tax=Liquidambar formosana TaxID=63359 RepID=A0AAP0RZP3_LIQFO